MTRQFLFTLLALAGLSGPAAADVMIGAAGPFSGPNSVLGEQLRRGVQQAVDDINATGGVRGERLAVTFTDDGCDPRKAVDAATGFVSAGVKAVIGHYCSGASIPASRVYEKAGIVEISPASTYSKYTDEGGWNVFRLVPRDDGQGAAAADLIQQHFAGQKVAILDDQSPGSQALARSLREGLAARSITPAFAESYKPGAKDYQPLALRIVNAGAGVVYFAGSYVESGAIARELRGLGSAAQFISGDALVTDDFYNIAKDAAEGTLMSFTFDPRKFEAARPVVERLKSADYNAEGFTVYSYAAVQAWVAAVEANGTMDSTRIAQWLRGGNRVPTAVGDVSFNAKGDLANPRYAWFKWIDGRYAEIDPRTLALPVLETTP